jgi:magnesium chelatase family protein
MARYLAKISGPLLDRIDLQVEVAALTTEEITSIEPAESSASIRERVEAARQIQRLRISRRRRRSTRRTSRKRCSTVHWIVPTFDEEEQPAG